MTPVARPREDGLAAALDEDAQRQGSGLTRCCGRPASRLLPALATALVLAACGSTPEPSRVTAAVVSPLNDLNIVQAPIPPLLAQIQQQPYALPPDRGCAAMAADIAALDALLGVDVDAPPSADNPSLLERGSSAAGDAAVGAIKGAAEGLIPYRGWVRKLSGAERYSREVAAAIAAGVVRRAYLKGLRAAQGC